MIFKKTVIQKGDRSQFSKERKKIVLNKNFSRVEDFSLSDFLFIEFPV